MNGSWRPTMAASLTAGRSVTCANTVIGTPSAPKATGAVSNMSVRVSASSGGRPIKISRALVMATGVPNPAMPSNRLPKQKPITTMTMRRSSGRCLTTHSRKASKRPETTAML